jgi:hypothetical protein
METNGYFLWMKKKDHTPQAQFAVYGDMKAKT